MNRFLRKTADRAARDLTRGFEITQDGSPWASQLFVALDHHRERRHHMAEQVYQQVLVSDPDHRDALYLYALLKLQYQDFSVATDMLRRLTMAHPGFARGWASYGAALSGLGHSEESIIAFQRALEIEPTYADAHYNLGQLHKQLKEWDNAVLCYRRAAGYDPTHAQAYNEMSECYYELGDYEDAMSACHSALLIDKHLVPAYNNLGRALAALGQTKNAEETFRTAIKLNPGFADAYSNLGKTFLALGRPAQALEACIQATQLNDDLAVAHCTRGESLRQLGRLDEAMQSCQRAIHVDPDSVDAMNGLGLVYLDSSLIQEAVNAFRKANDTRKGHREAASNIVEALKCLTGATPAEIKEAAENWAKQFAFSEFGPMAKPVGVQRVGFLIGNLEHSREGVVLDALLSAWDRSICEVFVYVNHAGDGPISQRISRVATEVRHIVGFDDMTVTAIIQGDRIDALVDMQGHSESGRLGVFVNHAAPIQISWWGGMGTSGLHSMSGILADRNLIPECEIDAYTEQVWYLPRLPLAYLRPEAEAPLGPPPSQAGEAFTFGCFTSAKKINKQVVAAWSEILRQVPGSRLVLKNRSLASGSLRRQYLGWFRNENIEADRIVFLQTQNPQAHFAAFNQIDIALDPFPCAGAQTTLDGLWMGVPTVSMVSPGFHGRTGHAILSAIGRAEWAVPTIDQYVDLAIKMANSPEDLAKWRRSLRDEVVLSEVGDAKSLFQVFIAALNAH